MAETAAITVTDGPAVAVATADERGWTVEVSVDGAWSGKYGPYDLDPASGQRMAEFHAQRAAKRATT